MFNAFTQRGDKFAPFLLGAALLLGLTPLAKAQETVGGGTVLSPAVGPPPSFGLGGPGMVLVKNWHFGADGTIKNQADMNANFFYHDPRSFDNNGGQYGSQTVAPDLANSDWGKGYQPIENNDCPPVRAFMADSLQTYLVPLHGATTIARDNNTVGNGSFMAKWALPNGGSLLGQDIVWETRVRYKTPPYFWFALWTEGDAWSNGAEHDLVESYGEDYGNGTNNFDGHLWHTGAVNGSNTVWYDNNYGWWGVAMANQKIPMPYDATQYHIWTWVYTHLGYYAMYVDGILAQSGSKPYDWTVGAVSGGTPTNVRFLFDAAWGNLQTGTGITSGAGGSPASDLVGKYYEFNYSRVYLSGYNGAAYNGPHSFPGTMNATDYDTGGSGVAYNQLASSGGNATGFRTDNSGADGGPALGWTAQGQWYKYSVNVPTGGQYAFSFGVGSYSGGHFHVVDETGRNLTGDVVLTANNDYHTSKPFSAPQVATLSAGPHVLTWMQDSGGYDLYTMTLTKTTGSCAKFVKTDTTTQGNWKGVYGADGYNICLDSTSQPPYGTTSTINAWTGSWTNVYDPRAGLQRAYSSDRIQAQWGGDPTYDIDCNLMDTNVHQVAIYGLDGDIQGRSAKIQVLDYAGAQVNPAGAVLDTESMDSYAVGKYLVWNIRGHVIFRVTNTSTDNLALAGIFFDPAPVSVEAAFNGPHNISTTTPCIVQAEDYDTGGEGVAYHDNDAANQGIPYGGGSYRPGDGVDLESCGDTGGGYDLGWTNSGEYLKYTVNVATPGTYTVNFRASAWQPVTVDLQDVTTGTAVDLTGPVSLINTGAGQAYANNTATVTLTQGTHVLKFLENGANFNLNYLTFTAGSGAPVFTEGFESGNLNAWSLWVGSNGAAAYTSSGSGEAHTGAWGYVNWSTNPYQLTLYRTVSVPNGTHTVSAWVKSSGGQTTCRMELTSGGTTYVNIPASGTWTQISTTVTVTNGSLEVGFYSNAGGGQWLNLDDVVVN